MDLTHAKMWTTWVRMAILDVTGITLVAAYEVDGRRAHVASFCEASRELTTDDA